MALAAGGHALLHKNDNVSAFGWIVTCLLFPLAGPLLYYLFGINRIRTRARRLNIPSTHTSPQRPQKASATKAMLRQAGLPLRAQTTAQVSFATPFPLCDGNQVAVLHNGEQAYPAMLGGIRTARRQILLSSYIFDNDEIGLRFAEALVQAAGNGVEVRVLVDGVGERYSWRRIGTQLLKRGVKVARFLPPQLLPPQVNLNLRNHRKILVIDGYTCFTGGINISARHCLEDNDRKSAVQDLHFRLQGPASAHLWQVFADDWFFAAREALQIPDEPVEHQGTAICRVVADGPNEDIDTLPMLLNGVLSSARRRIVIMTPYFLPPQGLISALQAAAMRGVDVRIILPSRNNLPYVHWATRRMLPQLLQRGVRIYYQAPPFSHSKLCLIDDYYCLLGSANLDPRSLTLNFEVVVEVFDRALVKTLGKHCNKVLKKSRKLTTEDFARQGLVSRLRDAVFWLFSSYM
ncbi:cardiolipin synthase [Exilibacterium tricleocarpae]|uniref:Cardiolipin synthase n=2 Tax=Exilibacterium tricleocarpae TaxID=2591008 RepID=A0A545TVX9_9GAMM|nr:cardiolipin synthase [Exilibacterium tricleocarpae]